ncbi:hypothetical protein AVEN_41831-1 [Araneus ventricosus]|uniref:Uncharacterized protein n=1 Tax=Araneus ventricosus TaxID=182803 RepID=A0A4Y2ADY2_ARAVE|nr:hypothetical protein AVEN_41831-1 [Araneus ventricosus]
MEALCWIEVDNVPPQVYQYIREKKDINEVLKCENILYPHGSTHSGVCFMYLLTADNCMKKMDIAQRKEKVKQDSTFRGLMREKNINLDEKDEDLSTDYANLFVGIVLQINCKAITEVGANKSYKVVSLSC